VSARRWRSGKSERARLRRFGWFSLETASEIEESSLSSELDDARRRRFLLLRVTTPESGALPRISELPESESPKSESLSSLEVGCCDRLWARSSAAIRIVLRWFRGEALRAIPAAALFPSERGSVAP